MQIVQSIVQSTVISLNSYEIYKWGISVATKSLWFMLIPVLLLGCLITYVPPPVCEFLKLYVNLKNTTLKDYTLDDRKVYFFSRWHIVQGLLADINKNVFSELCKAINVSNYKQILSLNILVQPISFFKISSFKKSLLKEKAILLVNYDLNFFDLKF